MVEVVKPKLQKPSVRITYAQPKAAPEERIDAFAEGDENQADDWKRLIGGGAQMMMGSTEGGTMEEPPNPISCMVLFAVFNVSIANHLDLAKAAADWKNFGRDSVQFQEDIKSIQSAYLLQLKFLVVIEAIFLFGWGFPQFIQDDELKLIFANYIPFQLMLGSHIILWTPYGLRALIPALWKSCGRPGGGLGKKIAEKVKALTPKPASVFVPSPTTKSMLTPAAISVGLATGVVAGARSLSSVAAAIGTIGATTCASILVLPVNPELLPSLQPKPDHVY